jgi:hypothetical protein
MTHIIAEKSYLMFENQSWRRFTLALSFYGPVDNVEWTLILCDRAGMVTAGHFKLNRSGGLTLVRVL